MKIALVTSENDTLPLSLRLLTEGHEVRAWQQYHQDPLTGLVEKLSSLENLIEWKPQLVVNLETSIAGLTEYLRKENLIVLGGSRQHIELEESRWTSLELARESGILIPQTFPFQDNEEALSWLRKTAIRVCCKVNNDAGEKHMSFLGKSNEDVAHFIKTKVKPEHEGMILQEFIEGPHELNIEGWFSEGELVWPMNASMEQKRLMPGDMGPNTGCQATITWPLADASLVPWTSSLLSYLKSVKYTGPLDMAFKLGKDNKFYFLEFTPRLGINAGFALIDLLNDDLGEFLLDLAMGRAREMRFKPQTAFILTVSVPPYPYEIPKVYLPGLEVNVMEAKDTHFWPASVKDRDGQLVMAEGYPIVGHASGWDREAGHAIRKATMLTDRIEVSGKQYRNDSLSMLEGFKTFQSMGIRGIR